MIPLRVLLIEDSELDAGLILRQLIEAGYEVTPKRVESRLQLVESLQEKWDLIIADYRLPGFTATEALKTVKESGQDAPFIIVSGAIGEETAVDLMKSGARDYIMKDRLSRLPPVVERELFEVNLRREQKKAHQALLESEENLRNSQRVAHIGHWVIDLSTGKETWSNEMYRILGVEPSIIQKGLMAAWQSSIHPDDRDRVLACTDMDHPENLKDELEYRIVRPDGTIRYILGQVGEPRCDQNGNLVQFTGVLHDITDRKLVELSLLDKIEESQSRARELEIVALISSRIRQANTHDDLVIVILEELAKVLGADHATFSFLQGGYLISNYAYHQQQLKKIDQKVTVSNHFKRILEEGRIGFFEKIHPHAFEEMPAWLYANGPRPVSMIAYPVRHEQKIIGIIYLDFSEPRQFNKEQRNLVEAVADMTGTALIRMAVTDELAAMVRLRERELESIYKVTSSASATLDINLALQQALELTLEAVHTPIGALFLVDDTTNKIELIASQMDESMQQEFFMKSGMKNFLERVIKDHKPLVIPDLSKVDRRKQKTLDESNLSLLALPMRLQDRVTGILVVIHNKQEQAVLEEMTLLSFIADHLALVVDNTRHYIAEEYSAVMEERSRLARELHDSVTQSLYSASLYSVGARRLFGQGKTTELDEYLAQIGKLTQQALKDMRLLVYELRSPELERNGLIGAIQNRLDAVERRSTIEVDISADEGLILPELVEEHLYRIAIEALNNSLKYSHASKVKVELQEEDNAVVFSVQDNGVGFALEQGLQNGGVGMTTMRERAERIGALYEIITSPQNGTKIIVKIPRKA